MKDVVLQAYLASYCLGFRISPGFYNIFVEITLKFSADLNETGVYFGLTVQDHQFTGQHVDLTGDIHEFTGRHGSLRAIHIYLLAVMLLLLALVPFGKQK